MLIFWGTVMVMVGAALLVVLRPLFGRFRKHNVKRNEAVVDIYRNRLQEMETEEAGGMLSGTDAETARKELAFTLLQEADERGYPDKEINKNVTIPWRTAGVIALVVPLIAVVLYLQLGTPDLVQGPLSPHASMSGDTTHAASIEEMVQHLADRLEQNPDDAEGWMMLVNSYMTLGRHEEALRAVERLHRISGDHPDVLVRYADVLATVNGGKLSGKPAELIQQALALDPENVIGLWLAGMTEAQAGRPAAAIEYWQRLLPHLEADPESQEEVRQLIAQAHEQMGAGSGEQAAAPPVAGVSQGTLTIKVNLSPEFSRDSRPEDALFIVARAVNGPPMPVAVIRKTAADLPLEINMDDRNSMTPDLKLSKFAQLEVTARVAPGGNALPQPGDFVSAASVVTPGQAEPVLLVIDRKLP